MSIDYMSNVKRFDIRTHERLRPQRGFSNVSFILIELKIFIETATRCLHIVTHNSELLPDKSS